MKYREGLALRTVIIQKWQYRDSSVSQTGVVETEGPPLINRCATLESGGANARRAPKCTSERACDVQKRPDVLITVGMA